MRLQQQLYDAFDLQVLYRHDDKQATIRATITTSTPATVAAIIHDHHQLQDPGHLRTLPHGRTYVTEPDAYPT
jgi:hypothetical protein